LQAFLMSSIVFSGSAQFAATQLIAHGALASVVIFSIIVINLRHVMYSATISPHFKNMSTRWKTFLAYLLTDEAFAMTVTRFNEEPDMPNKNWYFLGAGMALWVTWQIHSRGCFCWRSGSGQLVTGFHHCADLSGIVRAVHSG
jgi:predicted branched-subunit amino acid permease